MVVKTAAFDCDADMEWTTERRSPRKEARWDYGLAPEEASSCACCSLRLIAS
jgi:hypothetical protein